MPVRRGLLVSLTLFTGLALGPSAWATIDNLKSYKAAYPGKDAKAYSCKVCHQNVMGKKGDLNAYGLALQQYKAATANAKKLAVEDYRAIETQDADKDGVANLDEITKGTPPGESATSSKGTK